MNIKTKYRIPVLLNNKKTITENNNKNTFTRIRTQGKMQKYQLQRTI